MIQEISSDDTYDVRRFPSIRVAYVRNNWCRLLICRLLMLIATTSASRDLLPLQLLSMLTPVFQLFIFRFFNPKVWNVNNSRINWGKWSFIILSAVACIYVHDWQEQSSNPYHRKEIWLHSVALPLQSGLHQSTSVAGRIRMGSTFQKNAIRQCQNDVMVCEIRPQSKISQLLFLNSKYWWPILLVKFVQWQSRIFTISIRRLEAAKSRWTTP